MGIKSYLKKKIDESSCAYYLLRRINKKVFLPIQGIFEKRKLSKFKKTQFKKFNVGGNRFFLLLDPKNGEVDKNCFLKKTYDLNTTRILLKYLKENSTFVDIGANIGYFTNLGASICQKGNVYAFEPIKKIFNQNKKSLLKNNFKNVTILKVGVGNKKEKSKIFFEKSLGSSSILLGNKRKEGENIEINKLDNLIKEKIDFIKMDIEGFEYFAFLGMEQLIDQFSPKIVFEFSPYYYESIEKGQSKKLLRFLIKKGYSLIDIENNKEIKNIAEYLQRFDLNTNDHSNIFCYKNS